MYRKVIASGESGRIPQPMEAKHRRGYTEDELQRLNEIYEEKGPAGLTEEKRAALEQYWKALSDKKPPVYLKPYD